MYRITVAEQSCRPLYVASAGELGASIDQVEKGLTKVFDLAKRWGAVLLLDESDVFLEERSSESLERNQLVSGREIRLRSLFSLNVLITMYC